MSIPVTDAASFRRAASAYPTGVTVVTCAHQDGSVHGMTANSFVTVSADPPTVLIAVRRGGRMHALLSQQGRFGISVLGAQDEWLSRHFAGKPDTDSLPSYREGPEVPILCSAVAYFACHVSQTVDVHDHTLFIAHVFECAAAPLSPLLFYRSRCHACHIAPEEKKS